MIWNQTRSSWSRNFHLNYIQSCKDPDVVSTVAEQKCLAYGNTACWLKTGRPIMDVLYKTSFSPLVEFESKLPSIIGVQDRFCLSPLKRLDHLHSSVETVKVSDDKIRVASLYNIPECGYEGGDCCCSTGRKGGLYDCVDPAVAGTISELECVAGVMNTPESDECALASGNGTFRSYIGSEASRTSFGCNQAKNIPECGYDGGVCCCLTGAIDRSSSRFCLDHRIDKDKEAQCRTDVYGCNEAGGDYSLVKDAICHLANNIEQCNFDGGDCEWVLLLPEEWKVILSAVGAVAVVLSLSLCRRSSSGNPSNWHHACSLGFHSSQVKPEVPGTGQLQIHLISSAGEYALQPDLVNKKRWFRHRDDPAIACWFSSPSVSEIPTTDVISSFVNDETVGNDETYAREDAFDVDNNFEYSATLLAGAALPQHGGIPVMLRFTRQSNNFVRFSAFISRPLMCMI
jgi:hypothetical protein